ncbi:unnamed protein product [Caenorhabditis angaria]|uniref:F-box domain-containing protein n=1 Tax=Caenorhabditis angaria TaxID=860376 RepID=A0A9P1J023_9PELO|nr:unnamed protein product [Caenorhabditis angaria]
MLENMFDNVPDELLLQLFRYIDFKDFEKLETEFNPLHKAIAKSIRDEIHFVCNATIDYFDENLTLTIRSHRENSNPKTILLSDWENKVKDLECEMLTIKTDRDIPMDLMNQILKFESISDLHYTGPRISDEMLYRFDGAINVEFSIVVNEWPPNYSGPPRLRDIEILNDINSFEDVIDLINREVCITLHMTCETLVNTMDTLSKIVPDFAYYADWRFKISNVPPEYKDEPFETFINEIRKNITIYTRKNSLKRTISYSVLWDEEPWIIEDTSANV